MDYPTTWIRRKWKWIISDTAHKWIGRKWKWTASDASPPWWNPTLEMSSPAVAATQTTNPVGFLGAYTLLIGASGGYLWFLVFLSCIWLPLPLQLRQTIWRRRPTGTKPHPAQCTSPTCTHKKNFPIYVCRQAPVTFTNHHQIETGCIFTTNIPCMQWRLPHKWPFKLRLVPIS